MAPPMTKKQRVRFEENDDTVAVEVPGRRRGVVEEEFGGEEGVSKTLSLIHDVDNNNNNGEEAPMMIEPFNMDAERNDGTGYFDGDTYVFRRGRSGRLVADGEEEDAWLDALEEQHQKGMKDGNTNNNFYARASNKKIQLLDEDGEDKDEAIDQVALFRSLYNLMEENENVTQALKRLGSSRSQKTKTHGKKKKRKLILAADGDLENENDGDVSKEKEMFNQVSSASDKLMMSGIHDIYQMTREALARMLGGSLNEELQVSNKVHHTSTPQLQKPDNKDDQIKNGIFWEYRGNEDGQLHGPFTTEQMLEWRRAGYFVEKQAVDIRIVYSVSHGNSSNDVEAAARGAASVEDLMADLDSDDDEEGSAKQIHKGPSTHNEWQRSDKVDFSKYLQ